MANVGTAPLSSALKGFAVLEALAEFPSSVGVSELARSLDWSRGTVHKWLVTLVSSGWVEQDQDNLYRLTLTPYRIGLRALAQSSIDQRIAPLMTQLAEDSGETVSLAVLDQDAALIVRRFESPQLLSVTIRVGTRMSLATSASGLVLCALAGEATLARLRQDGVPLPDPERLAPVAQAGIAQCSDDLELGVSAVAVPISTRDGAFAAALSIAYASDKDSGDVLATRLLETQERIHQLIRENP